MKKILLDTNAVIALFHGDSEVLDCVAAAECVYVSCVVMGELYAGFHAGKRERSDSLLLEKLLQCSTVEVLPVGTETSDYYGRLFVELRRKGKPVPVNDLWIAAQTLECGATLVTFDRHFLGIPTLRVHHISEVRDDE